jgi:hypothetical protein
MCKNSLNISIKDITAPTKRKRAIDIVYAFFWPLRYYQQIYCQIYPLLHGGSSSPLPDPV